jgi:hypothetical protein
MSMGNRALEIVADLLRHRRKHVDPDERLRTLDELIDLYDTLTPEDAAAHEIRRGFLLTLEDAPQILAEERVSRFLAEHIEPEDFADFPWHAPDAVIAYCDMLHSFRFGSDAMATHIHVLEQNLLRYALQQYEQRGAYEQMFQLFRLAPELPALTDIELKRMRNRTYLYEMRRVRRNRRWLYAYLIVQVVLIMLVFPLLFVTAENGTLQRLLEVGAQVDLPPEASRTISYTEGLYWSLITAASIGYGDVTPHTSIGKALAAALGIMGVITVGVIAGLILNWISPRSID